MRDILGLDGGVESIAAVGPQNLMEARVELFLTLEISITDSIVGALLFYI